MESDDYRTFMTNLRAIGCPEQTLRDIITADVVGAYASKRNELMAARYRDFKYWEAPREPGPEFAQQRRAVDDETASALRQLLGEETLMPATANEWKAAELEQQLSFLSSDKLESTRSLLMRNQETDELAKTLSDGHRPTEDAEELQRILRAYEEKRASLSRLLTPEEYAKVEFAVSWTADNLRQAMKNFHPSEQEFQNIFRVWRAHDEDLVRRYATGEPDPGNDHVFARIREYLGEQRFEQYRRTWWQ